jgi:PAS domain S-box-containing protein
VTQPAADESAVAPGQLAEDVRLLLDASHDAIITMDGDGRIAAWNLRATEMFGWTADEARGRQVADLLVPPELRKAHIAGFKRRLAESGGSIGVHAFPAMRRDGSRLPVEIGVSFLHTRRGPLFVSFVRDITERVTDRLRQKELQRANEMTQLVIQNTGLAVAIFSLNGTFLQANDRACEVLGYTRPELAELTLLDIAAPEDRKRAASVLARTTDSGTPISNIELTVCRKDGERRLVAFGLSPVMEDGYVNSFVGAGEDITERNRTQEALANTQRLEALGALAGGVAHDFNNLLMAILGNVAVMRTLPPGDPQLDEALDDIDAAGKQAAELARQMLAYAGKANTLVTSLDLSTLVLEMDALLRAVVPRTVQVAISAASGLGAMEGDSTQLRQVVLNIAVNAAEAIGTGTGTISVSTGNANLDAEGVARCVGGDAAMPGSYVYVRVSDDGPGMDQETRLRVFDPFFSTRFAGRGLGLASVFGIVRGHNGLLEVQSAPGEGATFTVYFPVAM